MCSVLVCLKGESFARSEIAPFVCKHIPILKVAEEYDVLFYGTLDSTTYNPNKLSAHVNVADFFIDNIVKGIPSETKNIQMKIKGVRFISDKSMLFAGKKDKGGLILSQFKTGCHSEEEIVNYVRASWFRKSIISVSDYWMNWSKE